MGQSKLFSFIKGEGGPQIKHWVPWDLWPHLTVSDLRLSQLGGPGPHICIPQEQGGPLIPSGTGFPFCRLLLLAGLRWRYLTPPPFNTHKSFASYSYIDGSWSLFYRPSMYRTENTTSNSYSFACISVVAITWWLPSYCLVTGMFAEPFHSNGCLCCLPNSAFCRHATIFIQLNKLRKCEPEGESRQPSSVGGYSVFLVFMILL
jgi:hypothetical protein